MSEKETKVVEPTPGPWQVDEKDSCCISTAEGVRICIVETEESFPCLDDESRNGIREECLANSNLIAAAPDLLQVCRDFVAFSECHCTDNTGECPYCRGIEAIEKVTGAS